MQSAKDILMEVHHDVKQLNENVAILLSQDLNKRVGALEKFRERMIGLSYAALLLSSAATILSIILLIARLISPDTTVVPQ